MVSIRTDPFVSEKEEQDFKTRKKKITIFNMNFKVFTRKINLESKSENLYAKRCKVK